MDVVDSHNNIDCLGIMNVENGYECIEVYNSYNIMYAYNVKNSQECRFLIDCIGCQDCYGCFGLRNATYCIYNIPYTQAEFDQKIEEVYTLSISEQKNQFESLYRETYKKIPLPNTGSENVWESENIIESKNVSLSRHIR